METSFRSVPLTIIDFFGVLIPGLIWLDLLVTAVMMATPGHLVTTPVRGWQQLAAVSAATGTWLGPLSITFVALVIGSVMKARATHFATPFTAPWLKCEPRLRGIPLKDAQFPFTPIHEGSVYYQKVIDLTSDVVGCPVMPLPGYQPFGTAKRLLRLMAPPLWEELEHREAEIRLLSATLLAAVFAAGL